MANLNPKANLIHGVYSKDFKNSLTQEEVDLYNGLMDYFTEHYEADPFNLGLVDRYAFNVIKTARLDSSDFLRDGQQYNDPEVKMIRFVESLGMNRKFKESKDNKNNKEIIGIASLFANEDEKE